jgi:hypothetical protein
MAKDTLGVFAKNPYRKALINVADFCIDRAYPRLQA